jgi:hypothetical protein
VENLGIKPRNWRGVKGFGFESKDPEDRRKRNTAKPRGQRARKLDRKEKLLSSRRTDHANTVRGAKNPRAYRTPGSMKGR